MPVLLDIGCLATCPDTEDQADIGLISNAALAWDGAQITYAGSARDLPPELKREQSVSAGGGLVIPGLIDCHTHLAFGGWRGDEFEMRIAGASYLDIAKAGGGIASTVRATREADEAQLTRRCLDFLRQMSHLGVTTVEAKSGYGLSLEDEIKQLTVYRNLNRSQSVEILPTCLAAHIVPPEYRERRADYVELVRDQIIPAVAQQGLARFVDIFVEDSAFTLAEAESILETARGHGLGVKVHADQLSDGGGAALAARMGAVSGEHLEFAPPKALDALARAGTVAVSLPIASTYLGNGFLNARRCIESGVAVAVATDFNPGSAPSFHLPLAMTLACTGQRMTPAESLKGATTYAARAVAMQGNIGGLAKGMQADFAVIDSPDVNHWLYHFRANACLATFKKGQQIAGAPLTAG